MPLARLLALVLWIAAIPVAMAEDFEVIDDDESAGERVDEEVIEDDGDDKGIEVIDDETIDEPDTSRDLELARRPRQGTFGRLILSNFIYTESSGPGTPFAGATVAVAPSSPLNRLFGDLRSVVRHRGDSFLFNSDIRYRIANGQQSGLFGDDEYDVRELNVGFGGARTSFSAGRLLLLDVGGFRVDGVSASYKWKPRVRLFGAAGTFPRRGSRSVLDDYPTTPPIFGAAGMAFEGDGFWGNASLFSIVPLSERRPHPGSAEMASREMLRLAMASRAYWRVNNSLDFYEFTVVDFTGAAGFGLTNVSVGTNIRPHHAVRIQGAFDRVDIETLEVNAQTNFERSDPNNLGNILQNNINVQRVGRTSAQGGLSVDLFERRLELSSFVSYRTRPSVLARSVDLGTTVLLPGASGLEVSVRAVDRRFLGGMRVAMGYSHFIGLGARKSKTPTTALFDLNIFRQIGPGELETRLWFLSSTDQDIQDCVDAPSCYGRAKVKDFGASAMAHYPFTKKLRLTGLLSVGAQTMDIVDGAMVVPVPIVWKISVFTRLGYYF